MLYVHANACIFQANTTENGIKKMNVIAYEILKYISNFLINMKLSSGSGVRVVAFKCDQNLMRSLKLYSIIVVTISIPDLDLFPRDLTIN